MVHREFGFEYGRKYTDTMTSGGISGINVAMVSFNATYTRTGSGQLHSENDQPSMTIDDGCNTKKWHHHGSLHRFGGPAIIGLDPYMGSRSSHTEPVEEWWLYGIEISQKEIHELFVDPYNPTDEEIILAKLTGDIST